MRLVAAALLGLLIGSQARAASLFVDQGSGSDANDGLSWGAARGTINSAISTAVATPGTDTISVAAGCYLEQIVVPAGTTLLGGFPSGGGSRDPAANVTMLDGGGAAAPVVHFPPGSDGTTLDGFVVRGGGTVDGNSGGGILVEDSSPLIVGNVIEDNVACFGAGIALRFTAVGGAPRVQDNVVRNNTTEGCTLRVLTQGGGVLVSGPLGVSLGTVLSGNRIVGNMAQIGAGISFTGDGASEHNVIERNGSGGAYLLGSISIFDTAIVENAGTGVEMDCDFAYSLTNVTVAANDVGIQGLGGRNADLNVENSIVWGNPGGAVDWQCPGGARRVTSSVVQGGFTGGTGIIDADPLFASGPAGSYYLSQVASGQSVTSPAVDAGSQTAVSAGLDQRTTATDSVADSGTVDLGYHPLRIASLTILRGTVPNGLSVYRTVAALPFTDVSGTLSDPTLPLLYYEVPEANSDIGITKDVATDSLVLAFR